jgi:Holliday junction resolvasome RuvABC endonuclease subunit
VSLILGLDTSSTKSGIALIDEKKNLLKLDLWKKNKKASMYENLVEWQSYVEAFFPVDLVVIEKVSKSRNLNTVRLLAYHEAAVLISAQKWNIEILHISPMTARKQGLNNGKLKKEAVFSMITRKYKDQEFLEFDKGGNDQTDAVCLSLAGVNHLKSNE